MSIIPARRAGRIGSTISVIVVAAALVASGEENKAQVVESGDAAASAPASSAPGAGAQAPAGGGADKADAGAQNRAKVGDVVKLGDWRLQVNKVTDPVRPDNEYLQPDPGKRWVGVNSTVFNDSSSPQNVSSLLCFELRDKSGQNFQQTFVGAGSQMDGEVQPGSRLKGDVVFDVPSDANGFELHFKCDFLSSGTAIVDLGG